MSIIFDGQSIQMEISPLEYNQGYTVGNMYQYLQQYQLDSSQICLTLDGQTMLSPQDNSPIPFQPNSTLYIIINQPTFSIFFDGQQICQQQLQNMPIVQMIQLLQQQSVIQGQNFQIDFYDLNSQSLFTNADINENLFTYTNCNQYVIINITQIQLEQQKLESNQKVASLQQQNIGANELLQSLILLKNVSLLIDPNGQFVVYKFHFPTLVSGFLQKTQGKDSSNITLFNINDCDWVKKNNVEYCSFDDYGFAIRWEGGNISNLKIKQL